MAIKQFKLPVNEVVIGMYVSGLDRPWTQTPFPIQGFYIRDIEDVSLLRQYCKFVHIDIEKASGSVAANLKTLTPIITPPTGGKRTDKSSHIPVSVSPLKPTHNIYPIQESLNKEAAKAKQLHQEVFRSVGEVVNQLGSGGDIQVQSTKRVASSMVDSVLRNPDAFTWLSRVKHVDEHTYGHSVRSAVWAIIFGRYIGLAKKELDVLAMGVLLKDIGKSKLDMHLLESSERTLDEQRAYEKFIEYGVEMLRGAENVEPKVISVVKNHCERVNGSGFPRSFCGDKIPLNARIAGIVTFYDETINQRNQKLSLSPSKAVAKLYECRNKEFQEELVVEFIRAIGLYPTGTLVELSTGEVAVVVEQNFERRLKPKILIVMDSCKKMLDTPFILDLALDQKHKQGLIDSGKKKLKDVEMIEIASDLESDAFSIDIEHLRETYIFNPQKKKLFSFFGRKN
jgi:HD-GYP domain-containing protein (c-di-GMP phosphodiesterase class II)